MLTFGVGAETAGGDRATDDHCGIELIGNHDLGLESVLFESRYTRGRLTSAGLHQQPSVRREPAPRAGDDAPLHVKTIRAAIQCHQGLVQAGFGRHQRDCASRNVRGIRE